MKKINKIIGDDPRYNRYKRPLEAARVCGAARNIAEGRFEVVSFRQGLLTLACPNSGQVANLHLESAQLISEINKKLGEDKVERVRFKLF